MYISQLRVRNFRAISSIDVALKPRCNVIVGPNATGKTTILEAIRLAKALSASRTQGEVTQVLMALGVIAPHNPQRAYPQALAGNPLQPTEIRCQFILSANEIAMLREPTSLSAMATQLMLTNMGRQSATQAELAGLLSTEQGRQTQEMYLQQIRNTLAEIESGRRECLLHVVLNSQNGEIRNNDVLSGVLIGHLDRELPPNKTKFSYFPADRAIPSQEQPIQIGMNDANNQLESHNSQPQTKYNRLKNTIFGEVLAGRGQQQDDQFKVIFSRILRGKSLSSVGVNEFGSLRINIRDEESNKEFSLDAMSSGEKGLILTFLLIAQTLESGGIVLLDEPELHLNPAVCRDVLSFLMDQYAMPNELQLIICSHSPEILSVAFERDDCELYHLISGGLLTPVRRQDLEEVEGALRRLGASPSESLLYRGNVFVEGEHDSELLTEGFKTLFQRYKMRDVGGRVNLEREIRVLQEKEKPAGKISPTFFILDRDDSPTDLKTSNGVRILQWQRRCLENYLIDVNVLTDIVKTDQHVAKPITNVAMVRQTLRNLAFAQIDEVAARTIYTESQFANTSLTNREMQGKSFPEFANLIYDRIAKVREQFALFDEETWKAQYVRACEQRKTELEEKWDTAWEIECDGKRLIREFHAAVKAREGMLKFKLRIMNGMLAGSSENWLAMQSLLNTLMNSSSNGPSLGALDESR